MKKLLPFLFLLIPLSLFATSSSFQVGAKVGMTKNTINAGENYRNYKYSTRPGFKAEIPVIYQINSHFALESGIALTAKNYKLERSSQQNMINLTIEDLFISIPLAINLILPWNNVYSNYLSLGGYLGWWCWSKSTGEVVDINRNTQDVTEEGDLSLKNRLEYGLLLAVGSTFDLTDNFRLAVALEYEHDLSSLNKTQQHGAYPIYNRTLLVTTSLLWSLK